ncbi:MAG: sugar phosphate nucleotidyltransferase, partial [Dehalococcoidales bacterium]|nr:sugar phosphate nucleotidyltransferase [Dehalococcoidales bacterium]
DILYDRLMEDAAQPNSPHDFGYAVIPAMVKRDNVFAYKFDGYWQDIGTMEAYYAANLEIVREKGALSLNGGWPLLTEAQSQSLARIQSDAVHNSIISPGCVVKGRVENSVLSPGVWVEEDAVVKDSVIMANCVIGYHSVVDHCILDESVNVGKLCYLGFRGSSLCKTEDITVLGKGATVPAHTAVGSSCKVMPYVGLADFASGMVPSGTVVLPRLASSTPVTELKADKVAVK